MPWLFHTLLPNSHLTFNISFFFKETFNCLLGLTFDAPTGISKYKKRFDKEAKLTKNSFLSARTLPIGVAESRSSPSERYDGKALLHSTGFNL